MLLTLLSLVLAFQNPAHAWEVGSKKPATSSTSHSAGVSLASAEKESPSNGCHKYHGHWVGRGQLPSILTINPDCSGYNNLCGLSAKLEEGKSTGHNRGNVKFRILQALDNQPACPKAGAVFNCEFELNGRDVLKTSCSGFPSGVYDRALE